MEKNLQESSEPRLIPTNFEQSRIEAAVETPKRTWSQALYQSLKEPGSALQIVIAAAIAIGIGMAVTANVQDIPDAAPIILEVPGSLWLRALRATVLPLIITAIILAVQNLKTMAKDGAKLARWTVVYYVLTTCLAIVHSMILVDLVWRRLMVEASGDSLVVDEDDQEMIEEREDVQPHDIVVQVFESFIPSNVFEALAEDSLLAVLISALVVGCLIKGPDSSLLRAIREVDKIVGTIIIFLIKLAPIGVFFLILSNLMTLDIEDIGRNLGVLIGASIAGMFIHLFIMLPIIFFAFMRTNPYTYWVKCSPAWITAWGTASSAATLPVTIRTLMARGVPQTVTKFTAPLGALINMDGTAIYFPVVVVFLATTQGISLSPGDYVIIVLLSTLSSIATTPIPSSSLVLTVMIAGAVNVPITGMYAVVVAIDWFIDRFRTATNVSGDLFAAQIMAKVTGIQDTAAADIAEDEKENTGVSEPLTSSRV
ncbi:uncharacterized protein Z518_10249 [Rhinocladiella mackenziei CBS 650.93]|uniref:Amino acid transporter n=1 Tax=Rhinocladiella mackenziei CBS 650.93 TaxID=1442369 RepID=A0A0D2FDE5_9EURO|nr:uncharacterized protein Z518_10249 [Rhinocladiella mackenziei CBS 650.93]KIX00112.1 hypothetical protein Z518_10249 [Rhinocladiella mackenziei CBS 650.93]